VLVIQGTEDHIFPVSYTQSLYDKLTTEKKLRLFEGRSHGLVHEDPDGVALEASNWVRQHIKVTQKNR